MQLSFREWSVAHINRRQKTRGMSWFACEGWVMRRGRLTSDHGHGIVMLAYFGDDLGEMCFLDLKCCYSTGCFLFSHYQALFFNDLLFKHHDCMLESLR
jgi:hypothetical protein